MWLVLANGRLAHVTPGRALNMPVPLGDLFLYPCHLHENIPWWAYDLRKMRDKWSNHTDLQPEAEASQLAHRFMRINHYCKTLILGWFVPQLLLTDGIFFLIYFLGVLRRALQKGTQSLTFIIVLPGPWFYGTFHLFRISVSPHQWNSCTEAGAENIALLSSEYRW